MVEFWKTNPHVSNTPSLHCLSSYSIFTNFLQLSDNFRRVIVIFNKIRMNFKVLNSIWGAACLAIGAGIFGIPASGQEQSSNAPTAMVVASSHPRSSIREPRELLRVSAGGNRKIAEFTGNELYGLDRDVLAFLETSNDGSRLLVLDRKTGEIIAERKFDGFYSVGMKASDANRLAVRSNDSTVFAPVFGKAGFGVVEMNWKTGSIRPLPQSAVGTIRYEITGLYGVPPGIAVERGPQLIIFDTTRMEPALTFNNANTLGQPSASYVPVPGYGLVQASKEEITRLTESDFLTRAANAKMMASPESNRARWVKRIGRNINGKPSLIWAENESGVSPTAGTFSILVVFDLLSGRESMRKSLGADFPNSFVVDAAGENVFLLDPSRKKILRFDLRSKELKPFANLDGYTFINWAERDQ